MEYTEDNKVKFVIPGDAQEYLMLEEVKRESAKPMTEEEKLHDRVRRKMIGELYYQLGITDEYVAKKKAWLAANKQAVIMDNNGKTFTEDLETQQKVVGGANGSANADKREILETGAEIITEVGKFGVAALGGLEFIGPAVLGEAAYATVAGAIASITAAPFFGPLVLAGTVGVLIHKITKKIRSRNANLADKSQKVADFENELNELVQQLQVLQARLDKDHDMVYEQFMAYKNGEIKKKDFDAFVSDYTAGILGEMNIESKHPPKKGKKSVAKVNANAAAKRLIKPAPTDEHEKDPIEPAPEAEQNPEPAPEPAKKPEEKQHGDIEHEDEFVGGM